MKKNGLSHSTAWTIIVIIVIIDMLDLFAPIKTQRTGLQSVNLENGYYYCFAETDDGGLKQIKLNAKYTILHKTLPADEQPYLEEEVSLIGASKSEHAKRRLYVPKDIELEE